MPLATLFMVQLHVPNREEIVAWYSKAFGFSPILNDDKGDFTLLDAESVRIAIKGRCAAEPAGSISLVFRVDDLGQTVKRLGELGIETGPVETSEEGYIATRLTDPAGNRIQLFQWLAIRDKDQQ